MSVAIKRAYEPAAAADGHRALVDRIWPRGVTKEALRLDEWARDLAPSAALRTWFGHDPARWDEFRSRYRAELDAPAAATALERLRSIARNGHLTLVYGARDPDHNQAVVLADLLHD